MSNTTTQTTIQDLPSWMKNPLTRMISTAESLAKEPYPLYQGPRIAGFNQDQTDAFAGFRQTPTVGQAEVGIASDLAQRGAQTWADADWQSYMNPFMEAAIDPAARALTRTHQANVNQLGAQAGSNNAFGGSRQAILEGSAWRDYGQNMGDLYATGLASAYDRGQSAFQNDMTRMLGASREMQGIGQLLQNMNIAGYNALLSSGTTQRALDQANLDTAYQDFQEQRNWPYGQLSFFNSLIRGIPQVGVVETASTQPAPSTASQVLGAGIAGIGLIDKLSNLGT